MKTKTKNHELISYTPIIYVYADDENGVLKVWNDENSYMGLCE